MGVEESRVWEGKQIQSAATLIELSRRDSEMCVWEVDGLRNHKTSEQGRREAERKEAEAKRQ